ncbi:protein MIZU-KUSSEI 1 [Setaria italica]|uniref:protein MIZU-KUSSEI 1 n=1 Tax=Setaria italica TaxID=4555 RepID=UPI0003510CCE|nr:protein MIZU-KUSSEI 1 [Setaria italica]XP_034592769.1 protein MIZU-KUSSEI 1-like [Setaria viridis]
MTQPARRPTATTESVEIAFFGASSIPDPQSSPATPLPDIPFLHASTPPPPPPPAPVPQRQKHGKHRSRPGRLIRSVRAAFRSLPTIQAPSCRGMPSLHHLPGLYGPGGAVRSHFHGATHATGTLYGYRRARITVAFHESPGSPPCLLLDIAVPTAKFIQDVSAAGMAAPPRRLLDEPVWAAEVNGESVGYASRREMAERDERVMQMLHATSMGAGVLPADMSHPSDGELTYMRAHFDRVVGSKDAETYYMHNPEGGAAGPELTIFFIRT